MEGGGRGDTTSSDKLAENQMKSRVNGYVNSFALLFFECPLWYPTVTPILLFSAFFAPQIPVYEQNSPFTECRLFFSISTGMVKDGVVILEI